MKTKIVCENHLSIMVKRLDEEGPDGVTVISLFKLPYSYKHKCQYKPCGTEAYFRVTVN